MHWFWIDRFTVFESGKRAEAIKAISMGEDHMHQHFDHYMVMPASLIIEGVAQTAGMLIYNATGYKAKVVLAKLPKITFHEIEARPGDVLRYTTTIDMLREDGAVVLATVHLGEKLMAEGELFFAFLNKEVFADQQLFGDGDLIETMRHFGVFKIGIDADGQKLKDPEM